MFDKKGQGALEYLLLIGGAVLVAVIVITLLLQITTESEASTEATTRAAAIRSCEARLNALCRTELIATTPSFDAADITANCTPPGGSTASTSCTA